MSERSTPDGRTEADNQSKEVEIGGRRRGNSRSIDDVRCEGEEERGEAPNITQQKLIALKQIQAQKEGPTTRSITFFYVLGFVTGLVILVTAVARLVCPDLLG